MQLPRFHSAMHNIIDGAWSAVFHPESCQSDPVGLSTTDTIPHAGCRELIPTAHLLPSDAHAE